LIIATALNYFCSVIQVLFPEQSLSTIESILSAYKCKLHVMEDREIELLNRWLKTDKNSKPIREWDREKFSSDQDFKRYPKLHPGEKSCAVESVQVGLQGFISRRSSTKKWLSS